MLFRLMLSASALICFLKTLVIGGKKDLAVNKFIQYYVGKSLNNVGEHVSQNIKDSWVLFAKCLVH